MSIKDLVPKFGRDRDRVPVRRKDYDPFRDFQREVNNLFDDFFGSFGKVGDELALAPRWGTRAIETGFSPRVDVAETDKEVKVSAELPGMDEQDLTVELNEAALTICGEKKAEHEDKGRNWYTKETTYGSFHRVIPLPASVDGASAKARFKKGVLTVTVQKREDEQAQRKAIAIESD
jgi:HSP20 family protein